MNLDAYLKAVLTAIAIALVTIAIHLWGERLALAPAQAQTPGTNVATVDQMARRLSGLEQGQKEQAQRIEALRSALQSTVLNATRRGYFPDSNWSTVKWDPDVPPAGGN